MKITNTYYANKLTIHQSESHLPHKNKNVFFRFIKSIKNTKLSFFTNRKNTIYSPLLPEGELVNNKPSNYFFQPSAPTECLVFNVSNKEREHLSNASLLIGQHLEKNDLYPNLSKCNLNEYLQDFNVSNESHLENIRIPSLLFVAANETAYAARKIVSMQEQTLELSKGIKELELQLHNIKSKVQLTPKETRVYKILEKRIEAKIKRLEKNENACNRLFQKCIHMSSDGLRLKDRAHILTSEIKAIKNG